MLHFVFYVLVAVIQFETVVTFPHIGSLDSSGLNSPLLLAETRERLNEPLYDALDVSKLGRDDNDESELSDQDDEPTTEEATTSTIRPGFQNSQERVRDYGTGVLKIVTGAATLNLNELLHGSTQFIPPHIRVGVEDILGSIIGSPLDPNRFLVTYPPQPLYNFTTEKIEEDNNPFVNITEPPPIIHPVFVNPHRIPVAETEAPIKTTPRPLIVSVPAALPEPTTEGVFETTPEPAKDVDDNDNDDESEEDDNSRSLVNLIYLYE